MRKHRKKEKNIILKAPPRPRAVRILVGLFLIALIVLSMAAAGVVDHHSSRVGWGEHRTEFAFSLGQNQARITVLGSSYRIPLVPVRSGTRAAARVWESREELSSVPERLAQAGGILLAQSEGGRACRAINSAGDTLQKLAAAVWQSVKK